VVIGPGRLAVHRSCARTIALLAGITDIAEGGLHEMRLDRCAVVTLILSEGKMPPKHLPFGGPKPATASCDPIDRMRTDAVNLTCRRDAVGRRSGNAGDSAGGTRSQLARSMPGAAVCIARRPTEVSFDRLRTDHFSPRVCPRRPWPRQRRRPFQPTAVSTATDLR
jgi:hypothetical protein